MPIFSLTKALIASVILIVLLSGMGMFKAHIERRQQAQIASAVDAATQKLRAEIAEASRELMAKSQAEMAARLEDHTKRQAVTQLQINQLLSQVNGISENVTPAPVPVAPAPASRPKPKRHVAGNPQRDAVNRAHADADRLLERASRPADRNSGGAELAPAAPAPASSGPFGTGGLFGLWN